MKCNSSAVCGIHIVTDNIFFQGQRARRDSKLSATFRAGGLDGGGVEDGVEPVHGELDQLGLLHGRLHHLLLHQQQQCAPAAGAGGAAGG